MIRLRGAINFIIEVILKRSSAPKYLQQQDIRKKKVNIDLNTFGKAEQF